jgi:phytoene desaturase
MPRDVAGEPGGPRAVVIGAGFGGMAAALRARRLGYDVTLVDRLPSTGGRARVFRQDGFTFDAGPTVITAPQLFEELFALFGERMADHVEMLPVRPWYRILFADGRRFDYGSSAAEMRAAVAAFAPADLAGYDRLMRGARALYEVGFDRYGAQPFHTLGSMARALPALLRLGGWRSVSALAQSCIRDEALARVFSLQPLLVGGHPFRTSAIYALIPYLEQRWGVWFPAGGTGALVAALERLMRRQNIRLQLGRTVSRITVSAGRTSGVEFDDGTTLPAEVVIANADASQVQDLLEPATAPRRRNVDRMSYSFGLFVLCFGTDPSLQPPGCDGFYVLAPVPNLRSGIDWDRAAPLLRDRVVRLLEERTLPGLSRHIVTERAMTPRDFERDYLSRHGAGFSVAPTLLQSAWFRFHNRGPVPGLFLVGAGTHPGAGVPGVVTSAKVVEALLAAEAGR